MSWATQGRGTSNSNDRGNSTQRRQRKQWLLDEYGDGETVVCSFATCETVLTFETITVDRFPIPGCEGGTYQKGNIRPACEPCNRAHGVKLALERAKAARLALLKVVVHACPIGDAAVTPCCGRSPFELPPTDRITLGQARVTCGVTT